MTDAVLLHEREGVATLVLNRPATRNALDDDVVALIEQHCAAVNANIEIRAVILTGEGMAFSSGGNVKDMRDQKGLFGGSPASMRKSYRTRIQRIPRAIDALEVPIIAAINGAAIGAGLDLACMCDIRLAARSAVFASSFTKVGIIPGDDGAWLLPRVVGMERACEMIFTGDTIDAVTALYYGLISQHCPAEELMPQAWELALRVAANPPHVLRMAKSLLKESRKLDLSSMLEMSAAYQAIVQQTPDHREAVRAIFDKSPAKFTGAY